MFSINMIEQPKINFWFKDNDYKGDANKVYKYFREA